MNPGSNSLTMLELFFQSVIVLVGCVYCTMHLSIFCAYFIVIEIVTMSYYCTQIWRSDIPLYCILLVCLIWITIELIVCDKKDGNRTNKEN